MKARTVNALADATIWAAIRILGLMPRVIVKLGSEERK